jgi:ketosteroid isomerase-like protein
MVVVDLRHIVEEFDRAVDAGDASGLDAVCHPGVVTHSFGPDTPQAIEGMRAVVQRRRVFGSAGSWVQVVVVADGKYVVQDGTRSFAWLGVPFRGFDVPAGPCERDSAFMFRLQGGIITGRWAIRDDLMMLTQLGAVRAARPDEVGRGTVTSHLASIFRLAEGVVGA